MHLWYDNLALGQLKITNAQELQSAVFSFLVFWKTSQLLCNNTFAPYNRLAHTTTKSTTEPNRVTIGIRSCSPLMVIVVVH